MKLVIISHFVKAGEIIYQPLVDNLKIFFDNQKTKYNILAHPLNGDFQPFFENEKKDKKNIFPLIKISLIRYLIEIFYSPIFLKRKLSISKKEKIIFICIDPLSTLIGYFFSVFHKNSYIIYYIPDFSPKRFSNSLLNKIYHKIEKFTTKKSDEVWVVSKKVLELKKGLNQNIYLFPNYAPKSLTSEYSILEKEKNTLCMAGFLEDYYIFEEILEVFKELENYTLYIVGGGKKLPDYKKITKNNGIENIIFDGFIQKTEFFKHISDFTIGLALYTNNQNYNEYGDSVKCRDYISMQIPFITTDNHSLVGDVKTYNIGYVIDNSKNIAEEFVAGIKYIESNYKQLQNNLQTYYKLTYKNDEILGKIK